MYLIIFDKIWSILSTRAAFSIYWCSLSEILTYQQVNYFLLLDDLGN